MLKSTSSRTNDIDAAKNRLVRAPIVNKRARSASLSQPVNVVKKPNRRCSSLSPVVYGKKAPIPSLEFTSVTAPSPDNFDIHNSSISSIASNDTIPQDKLPQCMVIKLQRALMSKRREFVKLRKTLIQQQNAFLESYSSLRELETRIGQRDENIGDVRILSVTSWPAHDLLLLVRDDINFPEQTEVTGVFGPQILQQLYSQLSPVPEEVLKMGAEIMARRIDVLNLMRAKPRAERAHITNLEWKTKNMELDQETERLHRLVAGTAENLKAKLNYSMELAKIPWIDRDTIMKKLHRAQRENILLQHKMNVKCTSENVVDNRDETPSKCLIDESTSSNYQGLQEELAKERASREALKDVVSTAEGLLRVARTRIASLERQLKDTRAELEASLRRHKDLEQLLRQRETSYDARSKKLMEASKTGEVTIEVLSRQRDALELRVKELREQAQAAERQTEAREVEQRVRADTLAAQVAEQEKIHKTAENRVVELEEKVKELEGTIHKLRELSSRLVEIERSSCLDYLPTKESEPSDRETELWKELQVTRLALARTEEELRQSRADKDKFLNSLSKIAQDDAENLQNKMATEVLDKEQTIAKLQMIIDEQRENDKIMEQTMTLYENQLASLRLEVKKLRLYQCYTKEESYQDLQTELLEMHMRVESLTRERASLVSAAASRGLMLERHERATELFARITRARRELAAALEGRTELPPTGDGLYPEITRSLSSVCLSSQETWTALCAERARVLRLESAVLAQSMQLEREGRVRTQLERRRALLEREVLRAHTYKYQESPRNSTKKPSAIQEIIYYK